MILRELGDEEAFHRLIVPRWAHAPTSGAGAAIKGGRFNRPGLEALYLSQSAETAVEEYRQHARLLPPGILVTFLVSHLRVVDFSAGYDAGRWEPVWADYACNWRQLAFEQGIEPASWVLGDLALDAGASGVLFPATTGSGGTNLVLFNSSTVPSRNLRVHDPKGDLPHDSASWHGPQI